MIYFAYLVFAFTGLQFLIALLNYLFRADYSKNKTLTNELVSVIIPARNESKNIGNILDELSAQGYENLEIIVVNDDSEDNTSVIVLEKSKADTRIKLIDSALTDKGWLGKNHACFRGANHAKGKYLLFLDADVRLGEDAIALVLGYLKKSNTVFLSVFPKQTLINKEVKRIVPLMNYILLSLLPLFLVRYSKFPSLSAANGQLMLFDTEVYRAVEPHQKFRNEKVEDIHIARFLKKLRFKIACLTGNDDISCNMYDNHEEAMEGFSKNIVSFFGNSFFMAMLFWFVTFTGIIWIVIFLPWIYTILYITMTIGIRTYISLTSKQSMGENIRMHVEQIFNLGLLIATSLKHKIKKSYQWKGRNIGS